MVTVVTQRASDGHAPITGAPPYVAATKSGPTTEDEVVRLLDHASAVLARYESANESSTARSVATPNDGREREVLLEMLPPFLGLNSRAWSSASRIRLRELLKKLGPAVLVPILRVVAKAPRVDVIDEAALTLSPLATRADVLPALIDIVKDEGGPSRLFRRELPRDEAEVIRDTVASALGYPDEGPTRDRRVEALSFLLDDPSLDLRERALSSLLQLRGRSAEHAVRQRVAREKDVEFREALREALDELADE